MACRWNRTVPGLEPVAARAALGGALMVLAAGCSQTPDRETGPSAIEPARSALVATQMSQSQQRPYVPSLSYRYRPKAVDLQPRIVKSHRFLQCVPYARRQSNIQIRGDAWTWWRSARGRYDRGRHPAVGSVLVLKRKGRSRGHLAFVRRILDDRTIVVDHANWLNQGRIHKDIRVRDTSPGNDWSAVRVWYAPGRRYGGSTYHPHGFIYPTRDARRNAKISAATSPDTMVSPKSG